VRSWRLVQRHPVVSSLVALVAALAITLMIQTLLQAAAERHSLESRTNSTRRAIAASDLTDARRQIAALADQPLAASAVEQLRTEWQHEFDLQLLLVALSNPITSSYGDYLDELHDRVASNQPKATRSLRCEAAFAIARWRQHAANPGNPSARLQAELPRLSALLSTKPSSTVHAVALNSSLPTHGDASGEQSMDHVLAAIAMRTAQVSEYEVERELRRADRSRRTPLLLYALAISLEAQGRLLEAYETSLTLLEHPVIGALACWSVARLAASIGDFEAAERHLEVALKSTADNPSTSNNPLLRDLAYPSELQVLSEHDPDQFWLHWETAPPRIRTLPHYWRLAGYVRASTAVTLQDHDDAIAHFQRGLACSPGDQMRAGLELGIYQVEWSRITLLLESDQLSNLPFPVDEQVQQLGERAEALLQRCEQLDLPADFRADALSLAINCHLERGEWQLARPLFDRGARYDAVEPMAQFALQVARLAAMSLLDPEHAERNELEFDGHLATLAALAIERGHRVLQLAKGARAVHPFDLHSAKAAIIVCSAYRGDARAGLHEALTWSPSDEQIDDAVQAVANQSRDWGGVLLDHLEVDAISRRHLLLDAAAVVTEQHRLGHYTSEQVRSIALRWRQHASVQHHLTEAPWQSLKRALAELEVR
jgi:tetratricopeptide (TPR) repeat protein